MIQDRFEKHIDTLFRITHEATFNVSVQALLLILQVTSKKVQLPLPLFPSSSTLITSFPQSVSDRFYRTLYNSLLDPRLPQSSKQAMYLNLLFKSIKMDTSKERVAAFVRRLIQSLGMHPGVEFCCGVLYLLGEVCRSAVER
jgi:ribosome biogenesis protein MAK21